MKRIAIAVLLVMLGEHGICQQTYDLLIRNGHVIDPRNALDAVADVAILNGKVAEVKRGIDPTLAKQVVDAKGLYVTPGFIDIHTHVYTGSGAGFAGGINSLLPDVFAPRSGITTVADAGTSGWRNFPAFKTQVIDKSRTRVLAFLSIGGLGLSGKEAQEDLSDMNVDSTCATIQRYRETIVGVKIGHYEKPEWAPFDLAVEAAERSGTPLFVECHLPEYTLEQQLNRMRPGDIITHSYERVKERMSVVDDNGNVRPFVMKAKERGILFDLGHGGAGFWFSEAIPALKQGLAPNSFGTDLHRFSFNAGMKDMTNVISKYMAMGMELKDAVARATSGPANAIRRQDLGHLSVGAVADITIFSVRRGAFGFVDAGGNRIEGNSKLEAELTLREGKMVWDLNGRMASNYFAEGKQSQKIKNKR